MRPQTLAHVSDLHFGLSEENDLAAEALCRGLLLARVDHVAVTGDITHRGRRDEMTAFQRAFAPFIETHRLTAVPGNHDRMGDNAGVHLMEGRSVDVSVAEGLFLVQVDSTAPHNRSAIAAHGVLTPWVVEEVERAVRHAPEDTIVAVLLHHHVLPLPEESWAERVSSLFGWPYAAELESGSALLQSIRGRCDLVLHGHRHVPRASRIWAREDRPLDIYNAGSSTELGRVRVFSHQSGTLLRRPQWLMAFENGAAAMAEEEAAPLRRRPVPRTGDVRLRAAG
jgi:3',5'-cyclic-AMP phosphodiesterase